MNSSTDANEQLRFRPFQKPDQISVRGLVLDGLGEHFGFIDETLNPDLDDINKMYVEQGDLFVVAELDGELVGTGALIREKAGGRLVRMSVRREMRRRGIGRRMVDFLTSAAVSKGYRYLLVETNWDWDDAVNLYRDCGFTEYDRDDVSVYLRLDLAPVNKS